MNRPFIILISAMTMIAISCSKESLENTYNTQSSRIESWLNSFIARNDLMQIVTDEQGQTLTAESGRDSIDIADPFNPEDQLHANKGYYRLTLVKGIGKELSANGSATISCEGYLFNSSPSSMFYSTGISETAAVSVAWKGNKEVEPMTISLADKNVLEGLRKALAGAREKEECYVLFSGKYGMGKKAMGLVPANSALCYHIYIESVQ